MSREIDMQSSTEKPPGSILTPTELPDYDRVTLVYIPTSMSTEARLTGRWDGYRLRTFGQCSFSLDGGFVVWHRDAAPDPIGQFDRWEVPDE